jgi:transcriptional regulator with XRE-family HTH domain
MDLKMWRQQRGLTQSQLARLLEVETLTISRWERGATKRQAPGRMLELALKGLDVELAEKEGQPS